MRRGILIGGGMLTLAMAFLLLYQRDKRALSVPDHASPASIAPSQPLRMRSLGLHLLQSADPNAVQAGMETLARAAEQGDVEAQVSLGRIYLRGAVTVPKDAVRAQQWFLRAEQSARHPSAAFFLGVMAREAQGAPGASPDLQKSAEWLEKAAGRGSPDAMFLLGNAYRFGAGVPKNDAKALEYYQKGGELDHAPSLQALAMAYRHGELGVNPDELLSRRYMQDAEHALQHPSVTP